MITVSNFIGALMQALSSGRAMSDQTSARIADRYLQHDYLRGFPVPRMTLKNVEVEVNFAVGSTTQLATTLKHPEVAKNITHRFRDMAQQLPASDLFKNQFGTRAFRDEDWKQGIDELTEAVQRILAEPPGDKSTLQHLLTLATENFLYRMHHSRPQLGLLAGLRGMFGAAAQATPATPTEAQADAIRNWATQQVGNVLGASVPGGLDSADESPDLQILVGGNELETKDAAKMHTAKLSFSAEDRKWVASERNGEKTFILDR
jgi:hypothetical protein